MKTVKNVIAQRINYLLAKNNKKQKELAAHLGVTDNTVSYFAGGKRTPNIEQIIQIAGFFNVSTDYLLGYTEVETTDINLKAVCDYTGLIEDAVDSIKFFSSDSGHVLSILLSSPFFHKIMDMLPYYIGCRLHINDLEKTFSHDVCNELNIDHVESSDLLPERKRYMFKAVAKLLLSQKKDSETLKEYNNREERAERMSFTLQKYFSLLIDEMYIVGLEGEKYGNNPKEE